MRRYLLTGLLLAFLSASVASAQRGDFDNLLGKDLVQWESVGDGIWKLTPDGILLGYRSVSDEGEAIVEGGSFAAWRSSQAWLYTEKEYGEYDLHLDYFVGAPGNSGVSIRDQSRGQFAVTIPLDADRTPAHVAYEIQINANGPDQWPTGSIYGIERAKTGVQKLDEWNSLNIESRKSGIRVSVNGIVVAEHASLPDRPLTGPIGLQLHDRGSVVMFRDIWLMER
ncbi:MAG: DUF1080 domain-containing protein [Acidobacteria bacterium]|nr:DUF1080 domain-containing protein [Acidobacteriota bacterium]MDA1233791.1 DUF1080 domain-containing protein [Acidobacteriota bacterium]